MRTVQANDFGKYLCEGRNSLGVDQAVIDLFGKRGLYQGGREAGSQAGRQAGWLGGREAGWEGGRRVGNWGHLQGENMLMR